MTLTFSILINFLPLLSLSLFLSFSLSFYFLKKIQKLKEKWLWSQIDYQFDYTNTTLGQAQIQLIDQNFSCTFDHTTSGPDFGWKSSDHPFYHKQSALSFSLQIGDWYSQSINQFWSESFSSQFCFQKIGDQMSYAKNHQNELKILYKLKKNEKDGANKVNDPKQIFKIKH